MCVTGVKTREWEYKHSNARLAMVISEQANIQGKTYISKSSLTTVLTLLTPSSTRARYSFSLLTVSRYSSLVSSPGTLRTQMPTTPVYSVSLDYLGERVTGSKSFRKSKRQQ